MEENDHGYTIGFCPQRRKREPTPYDEFIGKDVRVETGGIGGIGTLISCDYQHGGLFFQIRPHIYTGPGEPEILDTVQPISASLTSSITLSEANLEKVLEAMKQSKKRNSKE